MTDLNKIYLFRMLHIDNMEHVLQYGITKIDSINANQNYKAIGDGNLISNRNLFFIPNGKTLSNYIPFYFWYKMPMLYVIQKGFNGVKATSAENIVYCITSVNNIINSKLDYVFTDGHAVNFLSSFYSPPEIERIDEIIDFKVIKDVYWNDPKDLDKKRRKEAEFLVEQDIPCEAIGIYAVYNQNAKNKLLKLGIPDNKILIKSEYYF
ncbi:type II toxin-antitoxin system toxin DNA ADP-ribosyl transferase DarT [Flavobacterium plantiphilum]